MSEYSSTYPKKCAHYYARRWVWSLEVGVIHELPLPQERS
jgi:hypothetical protein